MEGTSANLRGGDRFLVLDLLYGLLLPSGNDAALALAQYFGKFLSFTYSTKQYETICKN
jgi:D-alanyl-D-alanine carboxypeptidase